MHFLEAQSFHLSRLSGLGEKKTKARLFFNHLSTFIFFLRDIF